MMMISVYDGDDLCKGTHDGDDLCKGAYDGDVSVRVRIRW